MSAACEPAASFGRAWSRSFRVFAGVASLLAAACGKTPPQEPPPTAVAKPGESQAEGLFTESAQASGIDFHHFSGGSGDLYMAEIISPGAALIDYDRDGDLDVYLVQSHMLPPGGDLAKATFPPKDPEKLSDRLYRNELSVAGDGQTILRFVDVTDEAGLQADGYGVGVTVGDYDNDGWFDLYVTNLGPNQLWRNRGDGRFEDVTAVAGVGDEGWSVPAAFFDFDRDGWPDLFVGNYVDFPFDDPILCKDLTGARDYCGPASYRAQPDRLYHNRGDGSFEEVSQQAGLGSEHRPALGAVTADLNGDLWPDIYVANDGEANFLWLNQQDGTFLDDALLAGCAVNADGKAEGSMGVDAADFDSDGDLDLFMTHLVAETNTLFRNDGHGLFDDFTSVTGLGPPSQLHTSFGTGWFDYDNDSWLDLVVVNGAVKKIEALARANDPFPVHEPNQLFRNLGNNRFEEVTDRAGEAFSHSEASRGTALGDVDNDGDTDLLIANNNGPTRLLINNVGSAASWLGLSLIARTGLAIPDSRAAVVRTGAPERWGRVRIEGSFGSANDPRVLFGLAQGTAVDGVRVHWPDGAVMLWKEIPIRRYTTLWRDNRKLPGT